MKQLKIALVLTVLLVMAALVACGLPAARTATPDTSSALYTAAALTVQAQLNQPNVVYTQAAQTIAAQQTQGSSGAIYTQAAQTVQAAMTQTAGAPGNPPPAATNTPPPPAATNTPFNTAVPTNTQQPPVATTAAVPCDRATFISDVTYPDGTEVIVGTNFVKTWRIKNNGSCTWTSGYALIFDSGHAMNGPVTQQLTTGTVAPGDSIDISVNLKAPDQPGEYQGFWKLRNSAGATFGIGQNADKSFWVKIKAISSATATPSAQLHYDFTDKAPSAEWRNATIILPWGDPADDNPGVAAFIENAKLENNKTYAKVIATYPEHITDGIITGLFSAYTVIDGDHFRSGLGFRSDCGSGRVKFQLNYKDSGTVYLIKEWIETCDGSILLVDVDLSALKGKTVQFQLAVLADGTPNDDRPVWITPRIEK